MDDAKSEKSLFKLVVDDQAPPPPKEEREPERERGGRGNPNGSRMAMSRPIRLLAAATMALFLFLVLQIMRSPTSLRLPGGRGGGEWNDMARDPNLDGTRIGASSMEKAEARRY